MSDYLILTLVVIAAIFFLLLAFIVGPRKNSDVELSHELALECIRSRGSPDIDGNTFKGCNRNHTYDLHYKKEEEKK